MNTIVFFDLLGLEGKQMSYWYGIFQFLNPSSLQNEVKFPVLSLNIKRVDLNLYLCWYLVVTDYGTYNSNLPS